MLLLTLIPLLLLDISVARRQHSLLAKRAFAKRIPPGWQALGCATDSSSRALQAHSFSSPLLTPSFCVAECALRGYSYAGVGHGIECWCDDTLKNGLGLAANSSDCNLPCSGNSELSCGGNDRLSLFGLSSPSMSLPSGWSQPPVGQRCIVDVIPRVLPSYSTSTLSNTPTTCINTCASQGFSVAAVEFGVECFCSNEFHSNGPHFVSDTECKVPCAGDVTQTCGGAYRMNYYTKDTSRATASSSPIPAGWTARDCIQDSTKRVLPSYSTTSQGNTPASCINTCAAQGYKIAGVEFGTECWCANAFANRNPAVSPDSNCNVPCSGDKNQNCGGVFYLKYYTQDSPIIPPMVTNPSPATTTPKPTQTPVTRGPKFIVSHHMVGNTYHYSRENWLDDIRLAYARGIDGFALNLGSDSWQPARIADAYAAAADSKTGFKLFPSFDMTAIACGSADSANIIRTYIKTYVNHESQFIFKSKMLVSTFAGQDCTFGQGGVNQGWQYAVKTGLPAVSFIPAFFVDPSTFRNYPVMDGDFNWNGGWPLGNYDINFDLDQSHINGLTSAQSFIASASPWFFTHYGPDTYNKNWIYRPDNWLFPSRWEQLMQHRDRVDIVQVVTWNDYGESSYIGPIRQDQPMSEAWVNGYDHQGWLDLTEYYARAFKSGSYPTVTRDRIYLWSRPHPAALNNVNDHVGPPNNREWTQDYLWAVVFAASPAQFVLRSGSNSQAFNIPRGVSKFKVPSSIGDIQGTIKRGAANVVDLHPSGFRFTNTPPSYNFNAFVAVSP